MNETKWALPISSPNDKFTHFLELIGNDRIIFSGIFGIGKTYFLKEFFTQHEKYIALHIFPTNYSVAQNEDIFELIKYDIMYKLLDHELNLEKFEVSSFEGLLQLSKVDIYQTFKKFIKAIPTIGESTNTILSAFETLFNKLSEKKSQNVIDDGKAISEFAKAFENQKGSLYENGFFSGLITKLVSNLKTQYNKEVVLIVDDLDRIDPEHIFRIINIFAVHFKTTDVEIENKFGLDRIILSCDIENIRNIFANRYGGSVSFNGYVDKFYSRHIFHFDNKAVIVAEIENIIKSIKVDRERANWSSPLHPTRHILTYLLKCFVSSNLLNLRTLLKLKELEYNAEVIELKFSARHLHNYEISILPVFDFLKFIFGSFDNVIEVMKRVKFIGIENSHHIRDTLKGLIPSLVLIIKYEDHKFQESMQEIRGVSHKVEGITYAITITDGVTAKFAINQPTNFYPKHFREMLINTVEAYKHFIEESK